MTIDTVNFVVFTSLLIDLTEWNGRFQRKSVKTNIVFMTVDFIQIYRRPEWGKIASTSDFLFCILDLYIWSWNRCPIVRFWTFGGRLWSISDYKYVVVFCFTVVYCFGKGVDNAVNWENCVKDEGEIISFFATKTEKRDMNYTIQNLKLNILWRS